MDVDWDPDGFLQGHGSLQNVGDKTLNVELDDDAEAQVEHGKSEHQRNPVQSTNQQHRLHKGHRRSSAGVSGIDKNDAKQENRRQVIHQSENVRVTLNPSIQLFCSENAKLSLRGSKLTTPSKAQPITLDRKEITIVNPNTS